MQRRVQQRSCRRHKCRWISLRGEREVSCWFATNISSAPRVSEKESIRLSAGTGEFTRVSGACNGEFGGAAARNHILIARESLIWRQKTRLQCRVFWREWIARCRTVRLSWRSKISIGFASLLRKMILLLSLWKSVKTMVFQSKHLILRKSVYKPTFLLIILSKCVII